MRSPGASRRPLVEGPISSLFSSLARGVHEPRHLSRPAARVLAELVPDPKVVSSDTPVTLQREHRRRDVTRGRVGDLARERFAVADGEERVAAAVHHERRDRELGQALAPARLAVELWTV